MNTTTTETTVASVESGPTHIINYNVQPVTRQQHRHAEESKAYQEAVKAQGRRFVKCSLKRGKYTRHKGAKECAKELADKIIATQGYTRTDESPHLEGCECPMCSRFVTLKQPQP